METLDVNKFRRIIIIIFYKKHIYLRNSSIGINEYFFPPCDFTWTNHVTGKVKMAESEASRFSPPEVTVLFSRTHGIETMVHLQILHAIFQFLTELNSPLGRKRRGTRGTLISPGTRQVSAFLSRVRNQHVSTDVPPH